ncbi:MAG: hypothetical protein AB7D06_08840 [Pedobacter sp.]
MKMLITFKARCPECGVDGKHTVEIGQDLHPKKVLLCDTEVGGCDCYFAAFINIRAEAETAKIDV